MKILGKILNISLLIWSIFAVLKGFAIVLGTSGAVQGSEFGLLIILANELGLMITWLGLFALCNQVNRHNQKHAIA